MALDTRAKIPKFNYIIVAIIYNLKVQCLLEIRRVTSAGYDS